MSNDDDNVKNSNMAPRVRAERVAIERVAIERVAIERVVIGRRGEGTPKAEFVCIDVLPVGVASEPYSFQRLLDEGDPDKVSEMLDSIAATAKFLPLKVEDVITSWQKFRSKPDTTPTPPRAS